MSNTWPDGKLNFPHLTIEDAKKREIVLSQTDQFFISREMALKVKNAFADEMHKSLTQDQHVKRTSCLLNELSFITRMPSGKERGQFLSIDLGSTNFRVILSDLKGGEAEDDFHVKYYDVPQNLRYGPTCKPLFTFLAECIGDFIRSTPSLDSSACVPLAFSFSYPMIQKSHDSGFLVEWTKSYDLPDAVNKDAVSLLRQAIKETKVNCEVAAILNDSTGTLLKGAYLSNDCRVGMIFGSGFNCAYVAPVDSISKLSEEDRRTLADATHVAVDIECGAFGDNGCIDFVKNDIDRQLDADSLFKGAFSFEKMFAGNFFGDLVRRTLHHIAAKGGLFGGKVTAQLTTKDSLMAADCVRIERHGASEIRKIFTSKLGYSEDDLKDDDVTIIDFVGKVVALRAAVLPSILLSHLIDHLDKRKTVVAIDGSLYKHHPVIHSHMIDCISSLSPGKEFDIILAEDGSGKGAGLAAATLSTVANNKSGL